MFRLGGVDPPGGGERGQRAAGIGRPQIDVAAAEQQLVGLREKLDLSNTAAPALQIEPRTEFLRAFEIIANAERHILDRLYRRKVDRAAPDEGRDVGEESAAHGKVARHASRTDEGGPLQVSASDW